jgi:hypothetical protein
VALPLRDRRSIYREVVEGRERCRRMVKRALLMVGIAPDGRGVRSTRAADGWGQPIRSPVSCAHRSAGEVSESRHQLRPLTLVPPAAPYPGGDADGNFSA